MRNEILVLIPCMPGENEKINPYTSKTVKKKICLEEVTGEEVYLSYGGGLGINWKRMISCRILLSKDVISIEVIRSAEQKLFVKLASIFVGANLVSSCRQYCCWQALRSAIWINISVFPHSLQVASGWKFLVREKSAVARSRLQTIVITTSRSSSYSSKCSSKTGPKKWWKSILWPILVVTEL